MYLFIFRCFVFTCFLFHIAVENNAASSTASSGNVLDELKKQAEDAIAADEQKPEWQQYLEQNQQTGAYTYTDPNDGTVYEWDAEKRGWIPKVRSLLVFESLGGLQSFLKFPTTPDQWPNKII